MYIGGSARAEIPIPILEPKTKKVCYGGRLLRDHKEIDNNFLALRKKLRMSEPLH